MPDSTFFQSGASPDDQDPDLQRARELLAPDPIIKAAVTAVSGVFDSVATQLPDLIAAQAPGGPVPEFTRTMIEELQAQLRRALGLGQEPPP